VENLGEVLNDEFNGSNLHNLVISSAGYVLQEGQMEKICKELLQ
jgi:hypothetical protein